MARKAVDAVKTGELQFFPKSYESTWFNWMTEIRFDPSAAHPDPCSRLFSFCIFSFRLLLCFPTATGASRDSCGGATAFRPSLSASPESLQFGFHFGSPLAMTVAQMDSADNDAWVTGTTHEEALAKVPSDTYGWLHMSH